MDFPSDKLKLQEIYRSRDRDGFIKEPLKCDKISQIYGRLQFPEFPSHRCYTFGSFVTSLDGRIAFPDSPDGTLLAKKNEMDSFGGLCDFWILNLLRGVCDAVLMGSKTIRKEPGLTGEIHDPDLIDQRVRDDRPPVPLHIIVSGSGKNIPLDHKIISSPKIPALIISSPTGKDKVMKKAGEDLRELKYREPWTPGKTCIIGIGSENSIDTSEVLKYLKSSGIDSMLIESPVFQNSLLENSLLDELYLNTSGLFIGGNALSLGSGGPGFTSKDHPHAQLLSQHSHSDFFTYSRYRLIYNKEQVT